MYNIFNLISKFNDFSDTKKYKIIFFSISAILFILSYVTQILFDKKCKNIFGEIIHALHHLSVYFIFYGFLAPISILWIMLIILIVSFSSWSFTNNKCWLTMFGNKLCKVNTNNLFHDFSFYFIKKGDEFMINNRIKIYFMVIIFILLRLYEYYILNKSKNLVNNKSKNIKIHGHRGARGVLPENTLAALKYAIENEIDVLELDLQMTKDNEIIIYHDKNINTEICSGVGKPIKSLLLKEIKEYDCGSKKNIKFPNQKNVPNEKIPTFIELINMIQTDYKNKSNKIKMNIEIKTEKSIDSDDEVYTFSKKLIDLLYKYNITDNIIIQSFDPRALKYVKEIDPSIKTSYLIEDKILDINNLIHTSKELGVKIISPDYKIIDKNIVKKLQESGFEVLPWTVNDVDNFKNNIEYGVDGVITDYPKQMKDYLENM